MTEAAPPSPEAPEAPGRPLPVRTAEVLRRGLHRSGLAPLARKAGLTRLVEERMLSRVFNDADTLVPLTTHGLDLEVPGPLLQGFLHDRYEPLLCQRLAETVRPGDHVVDVGANIGFTACFAARQAGPDGRVVALEPFADTVEILEANISRNRPAAPVEVLTAAAGAGPGTVTFNITERIDLNGVYPHPLSDVVDTREVALVAVDDVVADHLDGRVDVVKIDVEGGELDVLDGMATSLQTVRRLFVEWNPACQVMAGRGADELPVRLLRLGFTVEVLDEKRERVSDLDEVLDEVRSGRLDDLWYANLDCWRAQVDEEPRQQA